MNNCFQIYEIKKYANHAGSKAPDDVSTIAEELGFRKVHFINCTEKHNLLAKIIRQINFIFNWIYCYWNITNHAILLIQFPFSFRQPVGIRILRLLKNRKKIKIISLIHDVEELRLSGCKKKYYKTRMDNILSLSDLVIVHNTVMLEWFVLRGVSREKLINLQIFDYLWINEKEQKPAFKKSISIAGNLECKKSGYIGQLGKLKNVTINLYGPNFNFNLNQYGNIHYLGSFLPDDLPNMLTEGFGLVWDGDSMDGCQGGFGEYLKYNNPHKLSLFLAAGLPVVIWKQAAEARFVEENGLGICVDSLTELTTIFEKLDREQYYQMAENVRIIGERLRTGQYTREALRIAHDRLEGK